MHPEIIIHMQGGLIQAIISNADVKIYVLDDDVFESSHLDDEDKERYSFEGVVYPVDGMHITDKDWEEAKQIYKDEWDVLHAQAFDEPEPDYNAPDQAERQHQQAEYKKLK